MFLKLLNKASLIVMATFMLGLYACSSDEESVSTTDSNVSLKSTTQGQITTMYIYRNPEPDAIGSYALYGINLTTDAKDSLTSVTTGTGNYQLYFYNEKVFKSTDTTYAQGTGCPAFFLGSGVTAFQISTLGTAGFNSIDSVSQIINYPDSSESSTVLPLLDGAPYRYTSGVLDGALISTYVKSVYYKTFIIGNDFQGLATASQPVYVIKITDEDGNEYYYVFMVLKFKNGSTHTTNPATDMYTMTIEYKRLYY